MACGAPVGPGPWGVAWGALVGPGACDVAWGADVGPGPWGVTVTANITPHADGIANYSDEDIANAIRKGLRPDGSKLSAPMAYWYYKNISDEDMKAIISYLRSMKPLPTPKG